MAVLALFRNAPTKANNVPDEILFFQFMQSRGGAAGAWGRQMIAAVFCRIGEVMPLLGFFEVRGLHINTVVACLSISFDISWSCFAVGITTFFSGTVIA